MSPTLSAFAVSAECLSESLGTTAVISAAADTELFSSCIHCCAVRLEAYQVQSGPNLVSRSDGANVSAC